MKISNKIKTAAVTASASAISLMSLPVFADAPTGGSSSDSDAGKYISGEEGDLTGSIKTIISGVIAVLGIVAVVVIIIGGVTYMTSNGDSSKVTKAKNTILYGIIGLVIAVLAYAVVNFVLSDILK